MNPLFPEITRFIRKLYNQPEGFIPLHAPVFGGNEKKYLEECIDSTFVSSVGKFVDAFKDPTALRNWLETNTEHRTSNTKQKTQNTEQVGSSSGSPQLS